MVTNNIDNTINCEYITDIRRSLNKTHQPQKIKKFNTYYPHEATLIQNICIRYNKERLVYI